MIPNTFRFEVAYRDDGVVRVAETLAHDDRDARAQFDRVVRVTCLGAHRDDCRCWTCLREAHTR